MEFVSTRNDSRHVTFRDALFQGLAPDGGLYRPTTQPDLRNLFEKFDSDTDFLTIATELTSSLLGPEISQDSARRICNNAFSFGPKLPEPTPGLHVLELFHGPSCAFKDYGASFLASAMEELLEDRDGQAIILTATSGDTGSAVAQAFHGKSRIDVVILYPSGRVSPLQEKQLTTLGDNVTALEVGGSFDDCQRMVKSAFVDPQLASLPLSSANSINLGRLIPQSFYYVWAWSRMKRFEDFAIVVPSGNFGNLTAGLYARSWGLDVKHFIAATNANDVIPEYLLSGTYTPRPSVPTYSNAMDVGSPSNYERLKDLYDNDVTLFRDGIDAMAISDEETLQTMTRVFEDYRYLLCPHTAVGWLAAERWQTQHSDIPMAILATAHPGKFVEVVQSATRMSPELPEALRSLLGKEKMATKMLNTDEALRNWLLARY